jgi:hypothetical protein
MAAGTGGAGGASLGSAGKSPEGGKSSTGGSGGAPAQASSGAGPNGGSAGSVMNGPIECRAQGDGKSTITLVNHCAGSLTFRGSDIEGGELQSGEHACRDVGSATDEIPAIRYWGFIGEDPGGEKHTLAELTLNTTFNDFDWYNISHVDAFNLPMQIVPAARPDCETLTCAEDFLLNCPDVGRYEDSAGNLTSCVSPNRDDGESTVALYFEACDDAYAWSGDDANGDDPSPVRACAGEDWDIVFCPDGDQ